MTNEQIKKLSSIFRRASETLKNSIDVIAQLAEDALIVFSEDKSASVPMLLSSSPDKELLTKKELADRWKVSERTISNLQTEGLPIYSLGKPIRFDYEECLTWAKNRRPKGRGKSKLRVVK